MGTKDEDKETVHKDLKTILDDPKGSKCIEFETFLLKHGRSSYLEFIWACQGMKSLTTKENKQRNKQLVTCLYRQYILNGSLSTALSNATFLKITQRISQHFESFQKSTDSQDIFKEAEIEVEDYLAAIVYPQFLKEINQEEGITRDNSSYLRCDDKSVTSHVPVINEDGLPQLFWSEGMINDLNCPIKPPKDPEIFAKELYQKLEALQESRKQQPKFDSKSECSECQKEEMELRQCFSANLAKAIEAKLMIYNDRTNYDLINARETKIKINAAKITSEFIPKAKPSRNRQHRRKKDGFILKTLCGLNTTVNDDSMSLLSFNSTNSTSTDTTSS